jgi:hypothetical protein
MRRPLTQRIAHGAGFYHGHADFNINIGLGIDGGDDAGLCSHALRPTRRTSLAKPKNPRAALVYLLLEPLSLGIPVKARCGLGETAGRIRMPSPKLGGQ